MRIVVFGASGQCGDHFVRQAVERGHTITAVVRPTTDYAPPAGVTVAKGDVLDADFVASVIPGHDVVMSGLGMRYRHPWAKRESPDDFTSRATAHIVAGMKAAGVGRISIISAAGIGDSRRRVSWPLRVLFAVSNVGKAYADMERVERVLAESDLDWQAVRPTTLTTKPATDRVYVTDAFRLSANIPRADVAAYILRELERAAFSARTPMITVNPTP